MRGLAAMWPVRHPCRRLLCISCLRGTPPAKLGAPMTWTGSGAREKRGATNMAVRRSIITGGRSMANPQWPSFPQSAPRRSSQESPAKSTKSLGVFGTLALVVGAGGLGAYMLDLHTHKCEKCGKSWRHLGAFNLGDEASHTCPCCGQVQWWKCGAPHVLQGSQFVMPPPQPLLALLPSSSLPLTQSPYDRSAEGSYDRGAEPPYDQTQERSYDRIAERPYDQTQERSYDRIAERSYDRRPDRPYDRSSERPHDQRTFGRPADRVAGRSFHRRPERSYDRRPVGPYDRRLEDPYDRSPDRPERSYDRRSERSY